MSAWRSARLLEEELEGRLQVAAGREADWQEWEISYA